MFKADIKRYTLAEFQEMVRKTDMSKADFNPTAVCLHHTFRPNAKDWGDGSSWKTRLGAMRDFYASKGWHSGPHLYIDPAGVYIYTFTPLTSKGVHAIAFNSFAWGIEAIGDFGGYPGQGNPMPEKQFSLTCQVIAALLKKVGVAPAMRHSIYFHRHDPQAHKTCPGLLVKEDTVLQGVLSYTESPVRLRANGKVVLGFSEAGITWALARGLVEALGGTVEMNMAGVLTLRVNGKTAVLAPGIYTARNGSAYVPLRDTVEHLGCQISVVDGAIAVTD